MKKLSASTYLQTIRPKAKYSIDSLHLPAETIRVLLVIVYLWHSLRKWIIPWRFFQLNSTYFNKEKGIFSKLEMDSLIPAHNKLEQTAYSKVEKPESFPVFVKPEWGQNSNGIFYAEDEKKYDQLRESIEAKNTQYIVQQAAQYQHEYEIYYLRSAESFSDYSSFSITQVVNSSSRPNPINSVHNPETHYLDITSRFTEDEIRRIWENIGKIGNFRMARVGIKADSRLSLVDNIFKIVEINIYLPMPLILLSENISTTRKLQLINSLMDKASRLVKTLPSKEKQRWIFFKKLKAHYRAAR